MIEYLPKQKEALRVLGNSHPARMADIAQVQVSGHTWVDRPQQVGHAKEDYAKDIFRSG